MEILEVARLIEGRISLLEKGRQGLQKLAEDKAKTIAAYDRAYQIASLDLIGKHPATLIPAIAKGHCAAEREAMELAEALYKIQIVKMDAVQAELNGFQSINRFLAHSAD